MKSLTPIRTLSGLAVCALFPVLSACAQTPVPLPFCMKAHSQMVLNLADGSFTATAWGEATHCGQSISLGWGWFNPQTGEGSGEGVIIAANEDQICFENPNMAQSIITGGSGRFEHATGEFMMVSTEETGSDFDSIAGTVTISLVWTASGWIKY